MKFPWWEVKVSVERNDRRISRYQAITVEQYEGSAGWVLFPVVRDLQAMMVVDSFDLDVVPDLEWSARLVKDWSI